MKIFKVQIDKDFFESPVSLPTGRELLELAGKKPASQFKIYLKPKSGQPRPIGLDEKVDLSELGVERFVTLPLDQTDGFEGRRDFALPQEDIAWLEATGLAFELIAVDNVLRVVVYGFPVPPGYNCNEVDVNVRIESGYPEAQVDMVYVHPPLARVDGVAIDNISNDSFDDKSWQRWSRHRTATNPWRTGIDNLSTHFGLIEHWFVRELEKG